MMELVLQCCRKGGINMFIKQVCQLCGKIRILNTDEKIGSEPRWEEYKLYEFGIGSPYDNYEINICVECHEPFIEGWGTDVDESGEQSGSANYDSDALHDAVIKSLTNIGDNEINESKKCTVCDTPMGLFGTNWMCPRCDINQMDFKGSEN